jgi:hypothetical protein
MYKKTIYSNIKLLKVFYSLIIALSIFSYSTSAQDKTGQKSNLIGNAKTELNGHRFITNSLVNDPFINTRFSLISGVGSSSNYDIPLVIKGKEITGLFGQLTYGTVDVRYQQMINNWLAFSVTVNVLGRLGSQKISFVSEGVNFNTNFNLGWTFKVVKTKKLMTSASVDLFNTSVTSFNLEEFINKAVENGSITPDNKIVKTTNLTIGTLGVRAAYAFSKTFGCIGKVNIGYGESLTTDKQTYVDAGLSIDADLNPSLSAPVGFAFGYNWNNYNQADISLKDPQNILFRINYTGRKDFDLGLEMQTQFFTFMSFGQEISSEVIYLKFAIAYFF